MKYLVEFPIEPIEIEAESPVDAVEQARKQVYRLPDFAVVTDVQLKNRYTVTLLKES